jgi:hypothetical protein
MCLIANVGGWKTGATGLALVGSPQPTCKLLKIITRGEEQYLVGDSAGATG